MPLWNRNSFAEVRSWTGGGRGESMRRINAIFTWSLEKDNARGCILDIEKGRVKFKINVIIVCELMN